MSQSFNEVQNVNMRVWSWLTLLSVHVCSDSYLMAIVWNEFDWKFEHHVIQYTTENKYLKKTYQADIAYFKLIFDFN